MARGTEAFLNGSNEPVGGGSTVRSSRIVQWAKTLEYSEGRAFWQVVVEAWPSLDLIPHDEFARLFARFRGSVPDCHSPERMIIYRGQDAFAPLGLSWTRHRNVAEEYARGKRGVSNPDPTVFRMKVTRDQVAFVSDVHEETDVVLWAIPSAEAVEIM